MTDHQNSIASIQRAYIRCTIAGVALILSGCASGGQIFGEGARWSSLVFSDARPKIRSPYRAGTAQAAPPKKTLPPNRCGHDAPPDRRLLCRGWFSPEIAKGGMK